MPILHPAKALVEPGSTVPALPCCDHYAGAEKFIRKGLGLLKEMGPVFDLTCDCEDGAPRGREVEHAEMIAGLILSAQVPGRVGVRIHDYESGIWQRDVDVLLGRASARIAYVVFPKTRGVREVREMAAYVQQVASRSGRGKPMPLHVLIETHQALHEVWEVAAVENIEVLDFGLLDFISEHQGAIPEGCMRSPGQFDNRLLARAKTEICTAALAHGVVPSHNITLDLNNPEQVKQDALRARLEFGFLRMWSIHPSQIVPIVEAYRPDFSKLSKAQTVLLAGSRANWAPVDHEGELHDRASYRHYWTLVQQAKQFNQTLLPEVRTWLDP